MRAHCHFAELICFTYTYLLHTTHGIPTNDLSSKRKRLSRQCMRTERIPTNLHDNRSGLSGGYRGHIGLQYKEFIGYLCG